MNCNIIGSRIDRMGVDEGNLLIIMRVERHILTQVEVMV